MSHDQPPRRGEVRSRLLSVTGGVVVAALVGGLLLWHGQIGEMLGLAADKKPVVSTLSAPPIAEPPATTLVTPTPTRDPSTPPATPKTPRTKKTAKPPKQAKLSGEESIDGLSPKLKARLK